MTGVSPFPEDITIPLSVGRFMVTQQRHESRRAPNGSKPVLCIEA